MPRFRNPSGQQSQRPLAVSQQRHIHRYVLADFRRIHIQMNHLRLTRISSQVTGHPVVKTHTYSNQYVTFIGLHIRSQITMHAQHTLVEPVSRRHCRKSQQRTTARNIRLLHKVEQLLLRTAQFHALAHQYKRLLCPVNQGNRLIHTSRVSFRIRIITPDKVDIHRLIILNQFHLSILCKIQYHRSRTTAACNEKRPCHCPGHVFGTADLIAPLRNRLCHTHQVDLLKRIRTQESCAHLTGNDHHWRTVNHGIRNPRNGIGSPRSAGHQTNPYLTRNTCKSLCRMSRTLLMTYQYMIQRSAMVIKRIEHRHNGSARITEQRLYSGMLQRPHQRLRSCYFFLTHGIIVFNSFTNKFFHRQPPSGKNLSQSV